jgi:hypothetical protein
MVCGLLIALPLTVIVPVRVPVAVGLNVIVILQVAFTPIWPLHLFVCEKSPLATMLEIFSDAVPVLVSVTVCDVLVVPTV